MKQHFVDVSYLIIYNILQSYAKLIIKIIEEVLFVYKSNSTDFIHDSLCCGAFVGKVGSDSNGKFSSKLFPPETRNSDMFSLPTNENINPLHCHRMILRLDCNSPQMCFCFWLHNILELHTTIHLHTKTQGCLQENTLQSLDTDMIHGSCTESWIEMFCSQRLEILNDPGPQMENIVPCQRGSLL